MKIKYCISALLLSLTFVLIVPSSVSYAFEPVSDTYEARVLKANMISSYSNNEFHIPPHSDDSTVLYYYLPLNNYTFDFEAGRFFVHTYGIPEIIVNQNSGAKISFVYTYEQNLVIGGKKYSLSANYKTGDSSAVLPNWTYADVYEWGRETYIEYVVHLTYTNMDSESILASFDFSVPKISVQIQRLNIMSPIYYIKEIWNKVGNGFEALKEKLDTINSTLTNKFTDMFNQMKEEHEETLNGYDDTEGTESNDLLDETLDTYQENEQAITEQAFEGIGEYTVTEEGAQSFAVQFLTVFPLVASMMQSFYQSASSFNIVISVMFTTIIASMVIGLFRFYRR